jgi:hypothetical protein
MKDADVNNLIGWNEKVSFESLEGMSRELKMNKATAVHEQIKGSVVITARQCVHDSDAVQRLTIENDSPSKHRCLSKNSRQLPKMISSPGDKDGHVSLTLN